MPGEVRTADMKVACKCGQSFRASILGLNEGDTLACPTCSTEIRFDSAMHQRIDAEFLQVLIAKGIFDRGDDDAPAIASFVRRNNRLPTNQEAAVLVRAGFDERQERARARAAKAVTAKWFPVGIVGESFFQAEIARCESGELTKILHEHDNPHDPRALIVLSRWAEPIGYIPQESFLHRALLDEQQDYEAGIRSIKTRGRMDGVVIDVALLGRNHKPLDCRNFVRR